MGELRFTILGCGSSGGVPRLGGHWGNCDPKEKRIMNEIIMWVTSTMIYEQLFSRSGCRDCMY